MAMGRGTVRLPALAIVLGLMLAIAAPAMAAGPASVSALAAKLSPAVVNIATARMVSDGFGVPFPEGHEGSELSDRLLELNPNFGLGDEALREARNLGSGFIIDATGLVVTNNHVIEGASEILVYLDDGTRLSASVVGADEKTDIAVLRVNAGRELPFVEFGDSDTALVGDWVMAIGNPFGLGGSVTLGIVSARNRDIRSGPYDSFIQTDASINQGNSGGPLFDMEGRVVGINTAIIAQGGTSLGIGFAVPVNMARGVIDQLAEFGETRRGWLGVGIQDVSEDIAASLGRTNTRGALVVDVAPTGPSHGLVVEGDVILEFDGQPIVRMRDLPRIVAGTSVGRAVPVKVMRGGTEVMIDITLGLLDERRVAALPEGRSPLSPEDDPDDGLAAMVGFDLAPLDDGLRARFSLLPESDGVVVTRVISGSDADLKGFLEGLLVTEVNQVRVATVAEVVTMVDEAKRAGRPAVLFKVADPTGGSRFVAVRLS